MMNDCDANLEELITVTTDGELEMKDDERMERIDRLYDTMMDNYSFFQSFNNQVRTLSLSRARENRETQNSPVLYGILKERL